MRERPSPVQVGVPDLQQVSLSLTITNEPGAETYSSQAGYQRLVFLRPGVFQGELYVISMSSGLAWRLIAFVGVRHDERSSSHRSSERGN